MYRIRKIETPEDGGYVFETMFESLYNDELIRLLIDECGDDADLLYERYLYESELPATADVFLAETRRLVGEGKEMTYRTASGGRAHLRGKVGSDTMVLVVDGMSVKFDAVDDEFPRNKVAHLLYRGRHVANAHIECWEGDEILPRSEEVMM